MEDTGRSEGADSNKKVESSRKLDHVRKTSISTPYEPGNHRHKKNGIKLSMEEVLALSPEERYKYYKNTENNKKYSI